MARTRDRGRALADAPQGQRGERAACRFGRHAFDDAEWGVGTHA